MNSIKNFLLELAYHEKASAEFAVKGASLKLKILGMSAVTAQKIAKKHFPLSNVYSISEAETVFILF